MSMKHSELDQRKLPRFHITPCQFHDAKLNKNFSVQDISLGGLSLRLMDRGEIPEFAVGTIHKGTIKVEGLKTDAEFTVRYLRGTLIGAEWLNLSKTLESHLDQISRPQVLGDHLKPYDLPAIANTLWFHNPVGVDLLVYQGEGASVMPHLMRRWTLYLHQSFILWEDGVGVRTGRALAEDDEGYAHGIVRIETRYIEYTDQVDRRLLESALGVIEHTEMQTEIKTGIINHLKGALS